MTLYCIGGIIGVTNNTTHKFSWLRGEYMATGSTVNVAVNVTAPGLSQANTEAQQLHSSLKGAATAAAAIRVATPVRTAQASMPGATDTNLSRGVAGVTGASGRDFAKQAQGLGGLVHVYATFAANLFAVSAAFGALSKAADTTNMVKGLDQLGAASGRSLGILAKQMVTVTDGALSLRDAMTSTALATAGGMSSTAILRMTEVAKKASQALGRDMTDSMDRLTKGIVKIQPELLDELGIMARVIPSQEAYARQLGKSVSALTDFERKQAFANAVLEEGERKFSSIKLDVNPYSQLLASMTNVAQTGLELVNKILTPIVSLLSSSPTALAAVMATIGGILLKQAVPALGQFKQSLEEASTLANKKATEAYLNQQLSSGKLDEDIRNSTVKRYKLQEGYYTKVIALEANASKFSSTRKNNYGERMTTDLANATDKELKIWETRAKGLQKNNAVEAAAIRDQIAGVLELRRINIEADEAGAKSKGKRLEAAQGVFSQESNLNRLSQEAQKSASKAYIYNMASQTQATEGFAAGVKNAYANARKAGTSGLNLPTGELTAAGDAATRLAPKLGLITQGIVVLSAVTRGAITAIGLTVSAFLPWLEIIGLTIAALIALSGWMSNNNKEADALSRSHDILADSLNTVDRVIKNLADNKDPLSYISTAATEARANALQTVTESLKQVVIDAKAATVAMNSFDRVLDKIKGTFGKSVNDQLAADLAGSISKAFKLVATGALREQAAKQVKDLLKIDVDPSSIDALKTAINANNVTELAPKLQAITDKMSHDISNIASAAKTLDDSFATAAKSYDTIVSSLMPTDNIAKLGFDLVKAGLEFDKALEDPKTALSQIAKTSKDISRLKLLDPAYAQDLLKSSVVINDMASSYANITKEIDAAVVKQAELSALIEETQKQREQDRFVGIDSGFEEIEKAKAELATLGKKISIKVDAKFELEAKLDPFVKKFTEQQYSAIAKGADYIRASIGEGFEKANITVSKALSEAQSGTIGGIKESAALDKQALASQRRAIEVNNSLILATAELTKVQEDILIEELKTKAEKATGPEKTKLEGQIKVREEAKVFDFSRSTMQQLANILRSSTATDAQKQAAKTALPTIQALEANRAKGAELKAGEVSVDIRAQYAIMDATANINKDIQATKIQQLGIEKAILDIQAKSAPYINEQLLVAQILNEKGAIDLKLKQDTIDYENKLAKLELDRIETAKKKVVNTVSLANIDNSIAEVKAARLRALAKEEAAASIKATGDRERRTKLIKDEVDFAQKLLDIQKATFNINRNKDLTIAEDNLSLAKEHSSLSTEYIINQTSSIALAKEQQRILEATSANLSAQNNEISDFDKKTLDINDNTSKSYKDALAFHTANLNKLKSTIDAEKAISNNKQKNIELDRTRNIELGKQLELEAQLLVTNTLRQNQTEIALANKSLDEQRLNNAKELNRLDEISYINSKGLIEAARQKLEYDDKSILATQAMAKAQNDLRIANIAAAAFDSPGEGLVNTNTAGQVAAQDAIKIAQSNIDKNTALYEILKQQTVEQKAHNLELQKQKDFLDNITGFTKNLTDLFGEMGTNIGSAAEAMAKLAKNTEDRTAAMNLAKPEQQEALQKKQTKAAITDITLIASANKKMFGEKTAGYKILEGVEKAGSIMTAALRAKELAATISSTAKLITESIPGIYATAMKQLGPIFGPIAATAAIATFVGGAFSGGGDTVDMTGQTAADRQTSQGTGTVTGDSTAKSRSINNSLDILNATSVEGLSYYNKMVELLTNINNGISGVAKGIYGTIGLTSGSGFGNKDSESSGFNILGGLFGSTTNKEIIDTGIAFKGTIVDFIAGSKDFVQAFENSLVTSTSSFLWISNTSSRIQELLGPLDAKVTKAISKVFLNAAETFVEVGSKLGMTVNDVMTGLSKIPLTTLVSLRGLKGQELEDALSSAFSSMLDTAASGLFVSLEKFNVMGEGMLQTAVRVVDGLDKINLGMESIGKATVGSGMTGFEISQWIIDAAGGLDKALDLMENFGSRFLTDAERLVPVAGAVTKEFTRLGISGTLTRDSFKNLVQAYKVLGPAGAEVYASLLKLSDGVDQVLKASEGSTAALLDQRITIYEKLGKTEEALTQSRLKQLDALDALLRPGQIYLNALEDEKTIKDQLITAYNKESTAIKSTISSLKASIKTLSDYKTALLTGSMTVLDPTQLYNQTKTDFNNLAAIIKAPAVTEAEKLAQTDAVSKFAAVSDRFLTASRVQFASSSNYLADFKSVSDFVDSSATLLGNQLTDAELQLEKLTASVNFLEQIKDNTKSTETLLKELKTAQATTEAARVVYEASNAGKIAAAAWNAGVETTAAVAGSTTAITSTANAQGNAAVLTIKDTTSAVNTTTDAILDSDAVKAAKAQAAANTIAAALVVAEGGSVNNNGQQGVGSNTSANTTTLSSVANAIINTVSVALGGTGGYGYGGGQGSPGANSDGYGGGDAGFGGGSQAFASGGLASGLALVGEQGPELVDFKTPGRVYSNPASNDLLSNADLIVEIRNLHKEIAQLRKDQREQTGYLIKSNYDANQLAAQQVADATEAAAATNAWNMRSAVKIA